MHLQVFSWLIIAFVVLVLLICKTKGLRSLLSLGISIVMLVWLIIPLILKGNNPLFIILLVALPVLVLIVYLTEGFNTLSHLTVVAVAGNFLFISALAWGAVWAINLSGLISEQEAYIGGYGAHSINLQSLLIAGIMLGTLGVLTEMIVTQVTTVAEVAQAAVPFDRKKVFAQSYIIGVAHLGSMINTLFLIYAGVSLPLLIILIGRNSTIGDLLHSQLVVTEIVRILIGAIGLIIAMPSSTYLATWWLSRNEKK